MHIHTGVACNDPNSVGAHYYDTQVFQSVDPWTPVAILVEADGTAKGMYQLTSGFGYAENVNHAVVIHAPGGVRVGCGVLNEARGGIHIHQGTSCATNEQVGGHFWNPPEAEDPWKAASATYGAGSLLPTGEFTIRPGLALDVNTGHTVVVHSPADGSRILCGILYGSTRQWTRQTKLPPASGIVSTSTTFGAYPGASVLGTIGGSAGLIATTDGIVLKYHLTGIVPTMKTTITPFKNAALQHASLGGTVAVENTLDGTVSLTYDLHGLPTELYSRMSKYPGSVSDYIPSGTVKVAETESGKVKMRWSLEGLRPTLKATLVPYPGSLLEAPVGTVSVEDQPDGSLKIYYDMQGFAPGAAQGGLHIHEGLTCASDAEVKGHYWNGDPNADPWGPGIYKLDADDVAKGNYQITSGYNIAGNKGHTVVVHNDDGIKIACGILEVARGGVHVHAGLTCDDAALVGGHYYKSLLSTDPDPWTSTFSSGLDSADEIAEIASGYGYADNLLHAVVVHSAAGTHLLCTDYHRSPSSPCLKPAC
jgi:hypothetical protein